MKPIQILWQNIFNLFRHDDVSTSNSQRIYRRQPRFLGRPSTRAQVHRDSSSNARLAIYSFPHYKDSISYSDPGYVHLENPYLIFATYILGDNRREKLQLLAPELATTYKFETLNVKFNPISRENEDKAAHCLNTDPSRTNGRILGVEMVSDPYSIEFISSSTCRLSVSVGFHSRFLHSFLET